MSEEVVDSPESPHWAARDEIATLEPPPRQGLPLYLRREAAAAGMILDPELWKLIPFRVLLVILEYVEVVILKDSPYNIPRLFYGYFGLDKFRKVFFVFPAISVRGDLDVDVPAPLLHIRGLRLRMHPEQVPHPDVIFPRLRRLRCLRSFSIPDDNPQNLEYFTKAVSRGMKALEIACRRPALLSDNDRLLRVLNDKFRNLKHLRLTTWKRDFLGEDPYSPEVSLNLSRLREFSLFDFPVVSSPMWFRSLLGVSTSLVSFRCVNCAVDAACLRAVGEAADASSSIRRVVLRRCVIEGGLRDFFARAISVRELNLRQARCEEDLLDGLVFNSENHLETLDGSEAGLGLGFWAIACVGLNRAKRIIVEKSGLDEESIRTVLADARWNWGEMSCVLPSSTPDDLVKLLVDAGASVHLK